jgi:hypothetical protein
MTLFEKNMEVIQDELGLPFKAKGKFNALSPSALGVDAPDTIDLSNIPMNKVNEWYEGHGLNGKAVGVNFRRNANIRIEGVAGDLQSVTLWEDGMFSCRFELDWPFDHADGIKVYSVNMTDVQYNLIIPSWMRYMLKKNMKVRLGKGRRVRDADDAV